jgi:hypothetical protein
MHFLLFALWEEKNVGRAINRNGNAPGKGIPNLYACGAGSNGNGLGGGSM